MSDYSIEIATAEALVSVRVFAVAIARLHGCDEDLVEDLKLAVSEAAALGLGLGSVRIEIAAGEGRIDVVVAPGAAAVDEDDPGPHAVDVISALFPNVSVDPASIRFGFPIRDEAAS